MSSVFPHIRTAILRPGSGRKCPTPQRFEPRNTVRCIGVPEFRTKLVRDAACLLDVDMDVISWSCGPDPVDVQGTVVQPDLRVLRGGGTEHIFVLDDDQEPPFPPNENRDGPSALRVLHRSELEGDRLENAKEILRYARWRVPLSDRIRLLAALDSESSLTLAECLSLGRPGCDAIAIVAALALHRFVVIDLDSGRIGPETRVTRHRG